LSIGNIVSLKLLNSVKNWLRFYVQIH